MSSTIRIYRTLVTTLCVVLMLCSTPILAHKNRSEAPKQPSATTLLAQQQELCTALHEILCSDAFVHATATVAMLGNTTMRELLLKTYPIGSTNVDWEEAKRCGKIMSMSGLLVTCLLLAGHGVHQLITNPIHNHAGQDHPARQCFTLLLATTMSIVGTTLLTDSIYASYKVNTTLQGIMHDVAVFATKADQLAQLVTSSPELQVALPSCAALSKPLTPDTEQAGQLAQLLQTTTLQNSPSLFNLHGRIDAAYALMMQNHEQFTQCHAAVQELAAAVNIAKSA